MNVFMWTLLVLAVALWSYDYGSLQPRIVTATPVYTQVACDDIVADKYTGERVCEMSIKKIGDKSIFIGESL